MSFVFLIPLLVLFTIFLVNRSVVLSANKMAEPESLVKVLWDKSTKTNGFYQTLSSYQNNNGFLDLLAESQDWTLEHNFSPDIIFEFDAVSNSVPLLAMAWKNTEKPEFFVVYYHPGNGKFSKEFSSSFANEVDLNTSDSRDTLLLPKPPEVYTQAFEKTSIEQLYEKHNEATMRLLEKEIAKPLLDEVPDNTIFLFISSIKREMQYLTSLPYWQYKGAYWFFVRKNILANKAISV